jgi:hypothetical protein
MRKRLAVVVVAMALFVLAFAPAALAATYGPYTTNGGSNYVKVYSYARYEVKHWYPSGTVKAIFTNSGYQHRDTHTGVHSTSWKVTADDAILIGPSDTHVACVPYV